jgi:putative PIN family toxin of toxin-antitoxin system
MRVVLDTNVLIAAFISRGVCGELLEHCVLHHTIVGSEEILAELREHLVGKFGYSAVDADEVINLLRSRTGLVAPSRLSSPACRDPDDDMVLGTAIAGQADCIVTGDKDLLVLREFQGIDIVRPAEFTQFEPNMNT